MAQIDLTLKAKPTKKKVIIVGAGLAGLAAAQKLTNAKTETINFDVKVLEAKSVAGGRVRSIQFEDGKLSTEIGASYLYHYNGFTSLTDFVERKSLAKRKFDGVFDEIFLENGMPNMHLLSNGHEITHSSAKYYEQIFSDIHTELEECSKRNDWNYMINKDWPKMNKKSQHPESITAGEYLEIRFEEAVEASHGGLALPVDCSPKVIFERMMSDERFLNGTKTFSDMDIHAYGDYQEPDGQYVLAECYQDILDSVMQDISTGTVLFDTQVKTIEWQPAIVDGAKQPEHTIEDEPPVKVVCGDGEVYEAHHVIVTVSLGVLKWECRADNDDGSPKQTLFSPNLPTEKVDAITKLGMGEGASVKIEFLTPLLDREHCTIELFWLEKDNDYPKDYPWARSIDVVDRIGSNTYCLWFTAEDAKAVEAASDEDVGKGVCQVLEKFLVKQVPRPVRVEKSMWISDPFVRGSYSYCAKGSGKKDRSILNEPISGASPLQILFAGEATHPSVFSSTNGAYETGLCEADRLLHYYRTA